MQISANDWQKYVSKLSAINTKAGELLQTYIDKHGLNDIESVITYAHALVTKYGEAGSELACQMYDALAEAQGAYVNPAEPASIANRHEVAGALLKTQGTGNMIPAIERLVKTAASDTMLKNAKRDNAEWAWVSHGDTCAFCMHLSSLGWMPASKAILRGEHAEHIHANCDCEFAIRFDGKSSVEGYEPHRFKLIYDNADGKTSLDKLNAIRRQMYPQIKEERNARRREIYASNHSDLNYKYKDVLKEYLTTADPFRGTITYDKGYNLVEHASEVRAAEFLHRKFGGNIILINEKNTPHIANPDYVWLENYWDLKNVTTGKACDHAIRHGLKQISDNPGGIILKFESNDINLDDAIKVIEKRMTRKGSIDVPADIILIKDDKIVRILRYK